MEVGGDGAASAMLLSLYALSLYASCPPCIRISSGGSTNLKSKASFLWSFPWNGDWCLVLATGFLVFSIVHLISRPSASEESISAYGRVLLFASIEVSIGGICFPVRLEGCGDCTGAKAQVVLVEDLSQKSEQSGSMTTQEIGGDIGPVMLLSIIVAQYPVLRSGMFCSSEVGE